MKKSNASIGGSFEQYFLLCLTLRKWDVVRIPDGCRQINLNKLIRVKSPFDFLATKNGKAIFCDTKTCEGKTFPHSKINQLQIKELLRIAKNGFLAGYVINFRETDTYSFISAEILSQLKKGKSVKASDYLDLGQEINIDKLFL